MQSSFMTGLLCGLFVLYFVRAAAWFVGAVITTARYLTGRDK